MSDQLGNLDVPGFEAVDRRQAQKNAGAIVREILADLGKRWALPPEDFALVLAHELARAIEASPALLVELSASIAVHLFRAIKGQALLTELERVGIRLRLDGPLLKAKGKITPLAAERIKQWRRELVAALREVG